MNEFSEAQIRQECAESAEAILRTSLKKLIGKDLKRMHGNIVADLIIQHVKDAITRNNIKYKTLESEVELTADAEYGFIARYKYLTADGETPDKAMQELARVILDAFSTDGTAASTGPENNK